MHVAESHSRRPATRISGLSLIGSGRHHLSRVWRSTKQRSIAVAASDAALQSSLSLPIEFVFLKRMKAIVSITQEVCVPGDTIALTGTLNNASSSSFGLIRIRLRRNILLRTNGGGMRYVVDDVVNVDQPANVIARQSGSFTAAIPVPAGIELSMTGQLVACMCVSLLGRSTVNAW